MSTTIVATQHSFDEMLEQIGRQRMTDSIEPGIRQPSSAYLKINALKPPTAQQIAQVMPGSLQAQWLELMFMREQVNLWLQRNATPFTPDDAMCQAAEAYLTGVRDNEADTNGTPVPADDGGLRPLRTRDLLAEVDWWRRTHGIIAWRVATSRLEGIDYWTLRESRPMPPQYEELLPYAYLHPRFPNIDEARIAEVGTKPQHPTVPAFGPVQTFVEGMWMFTEQNGIVHSPHRPPHVSTHNGGIVSYGAPMGTILDADESAAAYTASLHMSKDVAKAFVLGLSRWCTEADRGNPRSYVTVTVADYCKACGWKKHRKGGYFPQHKERARHAYLELNKVHARHRVPDHIAQANAKKGAGDETRYVNGQAMVVSIGTADADGHHPTAFRLSLGTWADDYLEDNPGCVALVLDRILGIDNSTRTGELAYRVGLYISLNWRTKILNNNAKQPHRVRQLLVALGIDPKTITHHEERRRLREYLEGAFDLLQEVKALGTRDDDDVLIEDWHYANASANDSQASAHWDEWLNWTCLLPPPKGVTDFYKLPQQARYQAIKEADARGRRRERAINDAIARKRVKEQNA